ncbi:MAG: transposase [Pseudomonadota bacterium]
MVQMHDFEAHFHPGRTWFFTLNLAQRDSTQLTRHAALLADSSRDVEGLYPFQTLAAVILPDHMHAIWTLPDGDADYDRRIDHLQSGFTRRLIEDGHVSKADRGSALWHPRYWDYQIRDEIDLERHIGYIHGNPVKHGLVSHPDKWRYSTWHSFRANGFALWTIKPLGTVGEA